MTSGRRSAVTRFLRSKAWPHLLGSGFVAGIASALVGAWAAAHFAQAGASVTSRSAPVTLIETLREANDELGIPDQDASASVLNQLGVGVHASLTVSGLSATRAVPVTCTVYAADAPAGWHLTRQIIYTVRNGSQITTPCFVPLPLSRRPRHYNAEAYVQGASGPGSRLVTSFVAPPTVQ
jgi:hypothetical protein